MYERMLEESPLVRFGLAARQAHAPRTGGIRWWEHTFQGHINLRGDPANPRLLSAVRGILGLELPLAPNTTSASQEITNYWLGPDEWLVVTPGDREQKITSELREALGDMFSSVTEMSGGQTIIVLRGAAVRDLLSKECPLDFYPRSFRMGMCAQSRIAKVPVLLRPLEEDAAFEIIVRRSFADYFWLWLEDAAAEYGLAPSPDTLLTSPSVVPASGCR